MRIRTLWMVMALILCAVTTHVAHGQQPPPGAVDEKAEQVLRRCCDYYKSVTNVVFTNEFKIETKSRGSKMEQTARYKLAFERPNRFGAMAEEGEMKGMRMASDGQTLRVTCPIFQGRYMEQTAPQSFDKFAEDQSLYMLMGAPILPICLTEKPYETLMDKVTTGKYMGQETYGNIKMDRLRFTQEGMDWDLWIDAGERPHIWRASMDLSSTMGAMMGGDATVIMMTTHSNPSYDTKLSTDTWKVPVPANASKVRTLEEAITGQRDTIAAGEKAPAFELSDLEGHRRTLADHAGKHIVVLDFWATWCPPCRKGLPIVSQITEKYANKGVVVYAVNLREPEGTVRQFLTQTGLDLNVLLDSQGKAGGDYGAKSIPTTVIIDKNGVVQSVHVGLAPNMEQLVTEELNALVEGKSLLQ